MHDTVSLVLVRFLALSSYFLVPVSLIVPSIRYRQILIPLLEKREHEKSFSSFYVNSSESISHLLVKMLGRISNDRLLIILLIINYFINRTINVLTIYRKDESFWFRFQPTIDLARHSTFDGFNLEEEFIVRRERKISLDDERGRPRIQSSVRLRRVGRRCNGRFGKEMENCAATVSLRGWFRARNSVSVLPFTVPFNLEGSQEGRWETPSRPFPFLASFSLHQLRIMQNRRSERSPTIGGCLSIVAYSIFFPSYFSRNHPLLFPFFLFASTSPTRKYLSTLTFLEESTVRVPFSKSSINTPMAIFREVTSDRSILLKIKTDACAGTEYAVNYLEHVQAVISVNATRRGDLELFLTSPMGTR